MRKRFTATTDRLRGLVTPWAGRIYLNAVNADCPGEGLGEKLYAFALRRMKEAGMKLATVGTSGDDAHAPARRAFEKVEFAAAILPLNLYKST